MVRGSAMIRTRPIIKGPAWFTGNNHQAECHKSNENQREEQSTCQHRLSHSPSGLSLWQPAVALTREHKQAVHLEDGAGLS